MAMVDRGGERDLNLNNERENSGRQIWEVFEGYRCVHGNYGK